MVNIQANMPSAETDQNVTMMLFGDAILTSASQAPPSFNVTSTGGINVRGGPSTSDVVVAGLAAGEVVNANGRNEAGDWLRIVLEGDEGEESQLAWVYASLMTAEDDIQTLRVVEVGEPLERALQSFTLRTTANDDAIVNGLLIQAPEADMMAQLTVNGVLVELDGTAFIESNTDNGLAIAILEGEAVVSVDDTVRKPVFGTQVMVPIQANLTVSGDMSEIEAYDADYLSTAPTGVLSRGIVVPDALDSDVVDGLNRLAEAVTIADPTLTADEVIDPRLSEGIEVPVEGCDRVDGRPAGELVVFQFGVGGGATVSDFISIWAGQYGYVRVDGRDLDVYYNGVDIMDGGTFNQVRGAWITQPGTHTVEIGWSIPDYGVATCEFTITG
jgi:uncharacterized protein YraI